MFQLRNKDLTIDLDESYLSDADDPEDPDWRGTPLHKRNSEHKRTLGVSLFYFFLTNFSGRTES